MRYKSIYKELTGALLFLTGFLSAAAQTGDADSLTAKFQRYRSAAVQEKLFVHVDKSFYLAGEIIWFKAYDVDARFNTPFTLSGIAYVELLDKDQKAVLQGTIGLKDGSGDGSFRIPVSIPSGHYTFRAYTSWMKNFSPDQYFRQQLTILNTVNNDIAFDSIRHEDPPANPLRQGSSSVDLAIQFFPEGGNLVNGLNSIVGFKAVNHAGNGVACQGVIIDQQKDTVARFTTGRFGMGHFTFTPSRGRSYTAIATSGSATNPSGSATNPSGSHSVTEKLPNAFDEGLVMHLDNIDAHHLRITVHSASMPADPTLYLFVHTRNHIRILRANRLDNNETTFPIDKDSLDDGISHFTVFNSDRVPVCERLYCKPPDKRLLIGVNTATASGAPIPGQPSGAQSASYDIRRKIPIDLSATDPSGHPAKADLSLSVFLLDSLQSIPEEDILSYLLLSSDLKGHIESPRAYFANTEPETLETLDDLMLTQGWTRLRWEDILHNKKPVFEFLPESNGPIIHAKLTDRRTGLPGASVIGYLSVPGRRFKFATAISGQDGGLFFHPENFYASREIVIQTNNAADSNYHIDIANPFSDRFSTLAVPDALFSPRWKDQLLSRSLAIQVENAYRSGEKYHARAVVEKDTTGFYGISDGHYNLDDYVRFVTMAEVIREYVENVKVRFQDGKAYFRVKNALFNLFFDDDPLLLIDGVPVFNGEKMIAINPLKIEKIDVVSHRYYLGPSITDGIVSFRSYDGDLGGYQLDPNAVVVQYNGLQEHRDFYSPVYETAAQIQSPLPDLRNQLLWRPDISIDSSGKKQLSLYTSDMTGTFALIVQGLSGDGLAGYTMKTFTVNPSASRQ